MMSMETPDISTTISNQVAISNLLTRENREDLISEILAGFSVNQKQISSRFFYDDTGSILFEKITTLPEYYPTRTEKLILKRVASEIMEEQHCDSIIELGSGDCSKISILLDAIPGHLLETIQYHPVDISETAVLKSAELLSQRYPAMMIHGLLADFIKHLTVLPGEGRRLICFFGSTLGNLTRQQAKDFVVELKNLMRPGDTFLLGLDMVKDIQILEAAYNDKLGVTEAFNKNILRVINQTAETNFVPEYFEHLAFYNREEARIEMHLRAIRTMRISSPHLHHEVIMEKGETIHTENSHKFTPDHILQLATASGLTVEEIYSDQDGWFSVVHFCYPE